MKKLLDKPETETYLSVESGRHVALLSETDEGHFDGQRQVRFGAVLRTHDGYVGEARSGSQAPLFGGVGVCVKIKNDVNIIKYKK